MTRQKDLIHKTDWDIMIVLDACRYDYFKAIKPHAVPATSEGIWTMEWLTKTFPDYYNDIVYVSGNAYCSNVPTMDVTLKSVVSFHGTKHFFHVVNAWDYAWDDKLKLINPKGVLECAEIAIQLHKKKKLIIHLMQPHLPFVTCTMPQTKKDIPPFRDKLTDQQTKDKKKLCEMGDIWWWINYLDKNNITDTFAYLYLKGGPKAITKAYMDNLNYVMKYVDMFTKKYSNKKIVITADHGNYLGEDGHYGHHPPRSKILTTVPWWTSW